MFPPHTSIYIFMKLDLFTFFFCGFYVQFIFLKKALPILKLLFLKGPSVFSFPTTFMILFCTHKNFDEPRIYVEVWGKGSAFILPVVPTTFIASSIFLDGPFWEDHQGLTSARRIVLRCGEKLHNMETAYY